MLAGGALRVTRDENCASAQEIDEKCARWSPKSGQNSRCSCFPRFRCSWTHLGRPTTFSIMHRRTRDPDYSIDQKLEFTKKKHSEQKRITGSRENRIRKSKTYRFVRLRRVGQLAHRPPRITLKHLGNACWRCSTSHS